MIIKLKQTDVNESINSNAGQGVVVLMMQTTLQLN